jgi:hypothetical protein
LKLAEIVVGAPRRSGVNAAVILALGAARALVAQSAQRTSVAARMRARDTI